MAIGILYKEELKEYDFGPAHPFRGDRYKAFIDLLRESLPDHHNYRILAAESATEDDLLRVCDQDYIDFTAQFYKAANLGLTHSGRFSEYHSPDNLPGGRPGRVEEAARLVIGQARLACDLVQRGDYAKMVSLGGGLHHAHRRYGEGFCIYNDVAFSALYLLQEYGLERVLIVDTDAHAGNGTSDYFYDTSKVLFIDLHQDPFTIYPGTGFPHQIGKGEGKGYTINVPLPVLAGDASYELAFDEIVQPVAEEFQPQIIIRNGGSDPHFADGLTSLGLTLEGFDLIGRRIADLSDRLCQGRAVDLICSGYNQTVLPYAWLSLVCGFAGIDLALPEPEPAPQSLAADQSLDDTRLAIQRVRTYLKGSWRCFRNA